MNREEMNQNSEHIQEELPIKKRKKKKKRLGLKIFLGVFLLLFAVGGAYVFSVYRSASGALETAFQPVETEREVPLRGEPISVLLLGVDRESPNDPGRSDTMMVVTINPNEGSTNILSLARDTKTEMVGRGFDDKINHAFAFGGAQMAIDSVSNLLNIPIDYFAEIDMDGFMTLVDVVGGVNVYNDFAFSLYGHHFPAGEIRLENSDAVLAYVRMRFDDPRGDFGRQERQRDVLVALVNEIAGYAVTGFQNIFETVGDNMQTNLTMPDIISISLNYHNALGDVRQMELRGASQIINGIYYQVLSDEQLLETQTILREHLELD